MSDYLGDFAEDATVRIDLTTHSRQGGAVAPSSVFEAADFKIYKNGSATQKTTTNGITMSSAFDGIVGAHHLSIDTSNDTGDAGFWVAGADYVVYLDPDETVDGQSVVRAWQFSIENRYMRGTDSAALASVLGTPVGADIAADIAENQTDLDTLLSRLSAARAGFLDNLNVGGNVASSAEVTAIQNNTRCVRVVPTIIERPDSGTQTHRIELLLYDNQGDMEAPDSAPTIALVDQDGTDLSARLDSPTMTLVSTGRYRAIYTATDTDDLEQLIWAFSVVEGGNTRIYGNTSIIVDTTAVDFTAADRTKLDTLHDTRLTAARAAALDEVTAARMGALTDWIDGGRLDLILDIIAADVVNLDGAAMRGTDSAALASAYTAARGAALDELLAANIPADVDTLKSQMGAITGSGANTLLGFFNALLNKAATNPSDIGGTFDPADDSTEAIRDRGDAAWTSGAGGSPINLQVSEREITVSP